MSGSTGSTQLSDLPLEALVACHECDLFRHPLAFCTRCSCVAAVGCSNPSDSAALSLPLAGIAVLRHPLRFQASEKPLHRCIPAVATTTHALFDPVSACAFSRASRRVRLAGIDNPSVRAFGRQHVAVRMAVRRSLPRRKRRQPEDCSKVPPTVSGVSSSGLSSAQVRLQALISSTREVLVTFMKNNFHAKSEGCLVRLRQGGRQSQAD